MPTANGRYLTPAQVGEIFDVSPKTVSRWAKQGRLPFQYTLGKHRRYPEAEIQELADSLRVEVVDPEEAAP